VGEAKRRKTALAAQLDETVAAEVAREMSATVIVRPLTETEIQEKEFAAVSRDLERSAREERKLEAREQRRQQQEAEAAAAQRRNAQELAQASRERFARAERERQVQADHDLLLKLEKQLAALKSAPVPTPAAARQQRVQTAYQNLMQTFDRILQPAELPPEPMVPDEGSPDLGPDFNPDGTIARFTPWQP
jgi:hypothetical protein